MENICHPIQGSFPGQLEDECIEMQMAKHPIALIIPLIIHLLLAATWFLLGYYWWTAFRGGFNLEVNLFVLAFFYLTVVFLVHMLFVTILNYLLRITIVTNSRIVDLHCTVLLRREREIIELTRIQDFRVEQKGFWKRLLNYGSIVINDASGQEIFRFSKLSYPHKRVNAINHIYQKAMQGRTMRIPGMN